MAEVAELGIVMLLFVVGLELSPARLWRLKGAIFGLGLAQVTACGLAVSATVLALAGYPLAAALAIGLPLGLSSTAQVLPMLQSGGQLRTPFGERAFSILLFQDLSIIPLITIVAALGQGSDEGPSGWMLGLLTLAAVFGLVAAGRLLIRPLVPPDRPSWRARVVHRRRAVHRACQRGGDGSARPVCGAGRVHRGRDAGRHALPPRTGSRYRAVSRHLAGPVFRGRGHDAGFAA